MPVSDDLKINPNLHYGISKQKLIDLYINNRLVVPIPKQTHTKCNRGCKIDLHREKCNLWLYYLYGIDFERLLCQ